MSIKHKTLLIVLLVIASVFIVPAIIIILHEYLNAIVAITSIISCFIIFGYCFYIELLSILHKEQQEEERIIQQFSGDLKKIYFYKGFKKYFDGDLDVESLKTWFKKHST